MKLRKNDELVYFDRLVMLENGAYLNAIRKIVSVQANMTLNRELYDAGLISKEVYVKNVACTQDTLYEIIEKTQQELKHVGDKEKELYKSVFEKES